MWACINTKRFACCFNHTGDRASGFFSCYTKQFPSYVSADIHDGTHFLGDATRVRLGSDALLNILICMS